MRKATLLVLMIALVLALFGATVTAQEEPVRVGSKQFTEQIVLGQIILLALEDAGFAVEDRTNLGSTAVNRDALVNAEIDVYPEYTGTAIGNHFNDVAHVSFPDEAFTDPVIGFSLVSSYDAAVYDLIWLQPAPANNTYAFAITRQFAEENGLFTMMDFADYVNAGGEIYMASGDEFAQRPDGIQSFEDVYGFGLTDDQLLIIAGGTPAQTEQALNEGTDGVNVAMAFATDGALSAYDFVVLDDPLGAQPIYAPTAVFRGEVLRSNPEIASTLNPIFAMLDNVTLQTLNAAVEVDGENPVDVAREWLEANGFIGG
jgi:osmoprotectant transport system substrate-binding protein